MNRGEFLIGEVSKRSGPSRKGIRPKGGDPMDKRAVSLCPHCDHCPEVVIDGDEVRIGEDANTTVLKRTEWNVLVDLIQSGQLTKF